MIVVIADDLTGAAEMAGIARKHGLRVGFSLFNAQERVPMPGLHSSLESKTGIQVLVVATDTRSGTAFEAESSVKCILSQFSPQQKEHFLFFKKTDSALRGHILAELSAMMKCLQAEKALLLAQNPSKKRVVEGGIYSINGTPLSETDFSFDPEFPAKSSRVDEILAHRDLPDQPACRSLSVDCPAIPAGIAVADAVSMDDIAIQLRKTDGKTLLAGGADLFETWLQSRFACSAEPAYADDGTEQQHELAGNSSETRHAELHDCIIVCGSTQSKRLDIGIPQLLMPEEVFHGTQPSNYWLPMLEHSYRQAGSLIISIGHKATGGKAYAVRLREVLAQCVKQLVSLNCPSSLIIEGGATAFAILNALGWNQFEINRQIAPGVVSLAYLSNGKSVQVILKPGSYPWGELLAEQAEK